MNDSIHQHIPHPNESHSKIKVTFFLDPPFHKEISSALSKLSKENGHKIAIHHFVAKTLEANWKTQLERYRKYGSLLKEKGL